MNVQPALAAESVTRFDVHAYVRALEDGDAKGGIDAALRCIDRGVRLDDIVRDLLAAAQQEVGRRWESGEWSVAHEHAATGITDAALTALSMGRPAAQRGTVVLACAESEWHSLPLRMVGLMLSEQGWRTMPLGASVPPDDLRRFLGDRPVVAVALSASLPDALIVVPSMVRAAHAAGVPVLAGGSAFGSDATRATRLGADAWAGDPTTAHRILESWERTPPALDAVAPSGSASTAAGSLANLIARTMLERSADPGSSADSGLLEHAASALRVAGASALTNDPSLIRDHLAWLERVSAAREAPQGYVAGILKGLRAALAEAGDDGTLSALLEASAP